MRPEYYSSEVADKLLKQDKVASIDKLKKVVGTDIDKTIFRILKKLSYCTSYSHRGKYYTLKSIPSFDSFGLWTFKSIRFSIFGTLLKTVIALVDNAEMGYSTRELSDLVKVEVKESLLLLFNKKMVTREKTSGVYVYYSKDTVSYKKQISIRKSAESPLPVMLTSPEPKVLAHELNAAIILFFSLLNEKQRRLYAGLESVKFGHGGDRIISELLGLDPETVAKGRNELLNKEVDVHRIRKKGGGRQTIKKKLQKY